MEKCSCWSLSAPFLLVVMIRPQKDGNWGEREDLGNSERDPRSVFYLSLCERKEMFIQNAASGARKREEHSDPVTSMNCWLQLSLPASSAGSQPSRLQTPVLIRGVAGQASSEKVMRMLLATVRVQATLSSRSILTAAGRSSEAKGPQLTLLFSPGEFDDSGWPALAPSPDLTGNPHFFQVTESLCLGFTSQTGTL